MIFYHQRNLILPPKCNPYRPVHQYQIKIYKAEGIPQSKFSFMHLVFFSLKVI